MGATQGEELFLPLQVAQTPPRSRRGDTVPSRSELLPRCRRSRFRICPFPPRLSALLPTAPRPALPRVAQLSAHAAPLPTLAMMPARKGDPRLPPVCAPAPGRSRSPTDSADREWNRPTRGFATRAAARYPMEGYRFVRGAPVHRREGGRSRDDHAQHNEPPPHEWTIS